MKNYVKGIAIILALSSVVGLAACQKKHDDAKKVKTEKVLVQPKADLGLSLEALDRRVTSLEKSRAAARRAMKQSTPVGF